MLLPFVLERQLPKVENAPATLGIHVPCGELPVTQLGAPPFRQ